MELRDYQQAALDAILAVPDASGIVVAPTGSGKTHIMAALYRHYTACHLSVLFVAWELSVRSQLVERYGVPEAIVVAPTVSLRDADIIIIDEIHHFHDSWYDWTIAASVRWIGFTATPRHCESYSVLHRIAYEPLRESGWLAERLSAVVVKSLPDALAATDGLHTVCYISSREDWRPEMGRLILAKTPASERHFLGDETRLACIATLTTGWDDPDIEAIILHRRIGRLNPQTYVQILGRLRRGGLVVDMSDNVIRFGLDEDALIASMSGIDRTSDKPLGVAPMKRCLKCERLVAPRVRICPHCGAELPPCVEGAEGRFWHREDDIAAWDKVVRSLDWQERKKCPYTKSGAWPVKLPNGVSIFVSSKTVWHWRNSLHHLLDAIRHKGVWSDVEGVYTIDTFVLVERRSAMELDSARASAREFYSIEYGCDWKRLEIGAEDGDADASPLE